MPIGVLSSYFVFFYCLKSLKKYRISFFIRIFAYLKHRGGAKPQYK